MTTIQIVALVAGGLIILSYFVDFKKILGNIQMPTEAHVVKNKESAETEVVIEPTNSKVDLVVVGPNGVPAGGLANIVAQWESLKKQCEQRGLAEAVSKLEEVFPLFVKKA